VAQGMPPCPECTSGAHVCTRGWNPGGPRVVMDVDSDYYSFSGWFECTACRCRFSADHPGASAPACSGDVA
jgi:hypothetical protein